MTKTVLKKFKRNKFSATSRPRAILLWAGGFAVIGVAFLALSRAATGPVVVEPEKAQVTAPSKVITDASASAGQAIQYGVAAPVGGTLPPGAALPSDATCAARVVRKPEVRPQNAVQNATAGRHKNLAAPFHRVTGSFTGTTDEILQWVACKYGIDENIVRAQAAKESYWTQKAAGDFSTRASDCPPGHPLGADGTAGMCPESYGILQVRWNYYGPPAGHNSWPEVETSTAYNADMAYATWRSCFNGELGWLNDVDRGETYVAGDAWGCTGVWFSGRWKTAPANTYIQAVKDYYNQKIWETSSFINYR